MSEWWPSESELASQIKAHWREHAPNLYRQLRRSGQLDQAALREARATREAAETFQRQGADEYTAWSEAMRDHALNLPRGD